MVKNPDLLFISMHLENLYMTDFAIGWHENNRTKSMIKLKDNKSFLEQLNFYLSYLHRFNPQYFDEYCQRIKVPLIHQMAIYSINNIKSLIDNNLITVKELQEVSKRSISFLRNGHYIVADSTLR